jgi:hypothetical protein
LALRKSLNANDLVFQTVEDGFKFFLATKPKTLTAWAEGFIGRRAGMLFNGIIDGTGCDPSQIVACQIFDEAGWFYPAMLRPLEPSTNGRTPEEIALSRARAQSDFRIMLEGQHSAPDPLTGQPNPTGGATFYGQEVRSLHYALTHAGYTVDFVDDTDLANGVLASNSPSAPQGRYSVLYITSPNVSDAAQQNVRDWVTHGGILVMTPGGGTANRYNTPTSAFDSVLGLTSRSPLRDSAPGSPSFGPGPGSENMVETLHIDLDSQILMRDPSLQPFADIPDTQIQFLQIDNGPVSGKVSLLRSDPGAFSVATGKTGDELITINEFGSGLAISYGFFPGRQYWTSPENDRIGHLPYHWSKAHRDIAVAPVRVAELRSGSLKKVILDQELVEACYLDADDRGFAIVLLNWADAPIEKLEVTAPLTASTRNANFLKVTTARGVSVTQNVTGDSISATLRLEYVDVLMVEPGVPQPDPCAALRAARDGLNPGDFTSQEAFERALAAANRQLQECERQHGEPLD